METVNKRWHIIVSIIHRLLIRCICAWYHSLLRGVNMSINKLNIIVFQHPYKTK